jgi:hypothetical protein
LQNKIIGVSGKSDLKRGCDGRRHRCVPAEVAILWLASLRFENQVRIGLAAYAEMIGLQLLGEKHSADLAPSGLP